EIMCRVGIGHYGKSCFGLGRYLYTQFLVVIGARRYSMQRYGAGSSGRSPLHFDAVAPVVEHGRAYHVPGEGTAGNAGGIITYNAEFTNFNTGTIGFHVLVIASLLLFAYRVDRKTL